jgi:autotransporter-associated beta strand protein
MIWRGVAVVLAAAGVARADVFNMPAGETSLRFVTVGDPNNQGDTVVMNNGQAINDGSSGYGAVPYSYAIGTFDVTVAQYCQFLNAVAWNADPYGLYNPGMATGGGVTVNGYPVACGIIQSGSAGSYSYRPATTTDSTGGVSFPAFCANLPVNWGSWGDAARFINWLQNGQPGQPGTPSYHSLTLAVEGTNTTDAGAYNLVVNGEPALSTSQLFAVTRSPGAKYFIPSENEWYKAAYYKGGSTNAGYWAYPTQSNTAPSYTLSTTGTNNANWNASGLTTPETGSPAVNWPLTPVGYYAGSPSPYGTYDQGGDLYSYTDTAVTVSAAIASTLAESTNTVFVMRGGSFHPTGTEEMASDWRYGANPDIFTHGRTFRAAAVLPIWNGAGTGNNWSTAANWEGTAGNWTTSSSTTSVTSTTYATSGGTAAVAPVEGLPIEFGPLAAGGHVANNNDLAAGAVLSGITFASGAPTYNLQGNSIALAGNLVNQSGSDQTIGLAMQLIAGGGTVNTSSNTLTLSGSISGSGMALTKTGAGTLVLSASNTYSGGTSISAGTLVIGAGGSLVTSAPVTLNAAGTFTVNSPAQTLASLNGAGTVNLGGTPTALTINGVSTLSGPIHGADGSLAVGDGTTSAVVTLANAAGSDYGGGTTVSNNACLVVANSTVSSATGTGGVAVLSGGTLGSSGGIILPAAGSSVTIQSGGHLSPHAASGTTGMLTIGSLATGSALNLNNGAVLDLNVGGAADDTYVYGNLNLAGTTTVNITGLSGVTAGGSYEIMHYTGHLTEGTADLALGTVSGLGGSIPVFSTATANAVFLNLVNPGVKVWTGAVNGNWDVNTTQNWNDYQGNPAYYMQGSPADGAVFSDAALAQGNGNVTVQAGGVSPAYVNFTNTAGTYTVGGGPISGAATTLTKTGGGTAVLTAANTYGGGTALDGGILSVTADNNLGTGPLTFNSGTLQITGSNAFSTSKAVTLNSGGGTLEVDNPAGAALAGSITGSGGLAKTGAYPLSLSGSNTYGGGTLLAAGQLNINYGGSGGTSSAIGTGTLTISGGSIDNTGSGDVTLSTNNAQAWNADFTYVGSAHNLNLGGGAVTLGGNRQVTVSAGTLTVGGPIGGGYALAKAGGGTLALTASNTYSGGTTVSGGTLTLSGSGTVSGSPAIVVNPGSTFYLNNNTGADDLARAGTAVPITLNGGTFSYLGHLASSGTETEQFGALTLGYGQSTVTVSGSGTGAGDQAEIVFGSNTSSLSSDLLRTPMSGSMVNFTATVVNNQIPQGGPGGSYYDSSWQTTGAGDYIAFGATVNNGPGSINGAADWIVVNGHDFARWSHSHGMHEQDQGTNGSDTNLTVTNNVNTPASSGYIVLTSTAGATCTASETINSLTVQSATPITTTLAGHTVNIQDSSSGALDSNGGICVSGSAPFTPAGNYTLTGGTLTVGTTGSNAELLVWIDSGTTTINSAIQDNGTLAKTLLSKNGSGTLVLGNTGNSYSYGTTLNGGVLNFANGTLPFSSSSPNIWFYGGTLQWASGNSQDVSTGIAPISSGYAAMIDTNGNPVTFADDLSGGGGLVKLGANTLTLAASNTYSGGTTISAGTLQLGDGQNNNGSVQGNIFNQSALVFANPSPQTYAGVISGSGNLTMTGPNTLILTASNTYSGGTTIASGTLQLGDGSTSNGYVQNNVTVNNGAVLAFANPSPQTFAGVISGSGSVNLAGPGTLTLAASNGYSGGTTLGNATVNFASGGLGGGPLRIAPGSGQSGTLVFGGGSGGSRSDLAATAITLASGTAVFDLQNNTVNLNAGMTGGGGLLLNDSFGTGTLALGAVASSYGGGTTIARGTLQIKADNLLPTAGVVAINGGSTATINGTPYVYGGTLDLAGNDQTLGGLTGGAAGDGGISGIVTNSAGSTTSLLTIAGGNNTFAGVIQDGAGQIALVTSGGTLTLTGSNAYSGGTTINGGTLSVAADRNLGAVPGAATPGSLVISGGTLGTTGSFALSASRGIALGPAGGSGTGTIDVANATILTYGGSIANNAGGSGGLIKADSGTLLLTAANAYTGGTTVAAGSLQLGNGNPGSDGAIQSNTITINANAALVFDLYNSQTYSAVISGGGSLTQAGPGALVLTGGNAYGATTIQTGSTLAVGNGGSAGTLGTGAVADSGSLVVDRSGEVDFSSPGQTISGPGSLVVAGGGTLVLGAGNTYQGGTTLGNATVNFASGGLGGGPLRIAPGSGQSGTLVFGGGSGGSRSDLAATAITLASGTAVFDLQNNTVNLNAGLTGGGGLLLNDSFGTGTLALGAVASSYGGGTTIARGTLQIGADNLLPTGGVVAINGGSTATINGTPYVYGGTLDLAGNDQTLGGLTGGAAGDGGISGIVTNSAGSTTSLLTIAGGNSTFAGVIQDGAGQVALVTSGGTLTLSGSNAYSGGTSVTGGLLAAENVAAIPSGSLLAIGADGSVVLGTPGAVEPLGQPSGGAGPLGSQPSGGSINPVPEPATAALLAAAATCGLALRLRRKGLGTRNQG